MSAVLKPVPARCRPMVLPDLRQVLEIETAAYEFPWSHGIFQDCLRVGYCCWVLERQYAVIGYCVMSVGAGECHILNLCIRPELHNLGFGRMLLDHLLDVARNHHADSAFLEVRPSNEIAKRLYLGAGFDEVGMRRNYYPAQRGREDAIIMARSLV
ncbi:MAG: ribosomal protein S18-alanine N-acetyltransferase [Gammaproteobacteria bacterium]|nr:ribosomal protein S18-alanine N-acetyltransferase [Gammaproteobacteria bacterium]